MAKFDVSEERLERLEALRVEAESHDEVITELCNIYEAEELRLIHPTDG
jgi:hypothetical protein